MPGKALAQINDEDALKDLKTYFDIEGNGRPLFTGSRFDTFAGGGDNVEANRITSDDLIAVSMLSVHVPAEAALGILGSHAEKISELLIRIPKDLKFETLTTKEFQQYLASESPAVQLWQLLRQQGDRWGVGQTTASKIMARKRPQLIPIYDSVVAMEVGIRGSSTQWDRWHQAFIESSDGGANLIERLELIRTASGQTHLSLLRVLDIVLWRNGRRKRNTPDPALENE
ncbi:DUF6308 family protein [Glutamicibacter arilaitensis]|uniref:DUF6308 family protein n=1 Tax=Glutamicibacter arilaitensis TaxID=256701 RepID=UPI003A9267AE